MVEMAEELLQRKGLDAQKVTNNMEGIGWPRRQRNADRWR